ncbi:TorF family putative porin [Pseudomonas sp. TB1-B1]|uniref:TorF family putative porin n=1 Tax=Pseudomonas sp. TB1-B1 TaxID=2985515 RepID=UPI002270211A|nr:TorF family putative porin [Pseudomonas sp. TB1-B1]MCX9150118.1 TorF family putative porin [Pseudomonas sp. TB1-B1]
MKLNVLSVIPAIALSLAGPVQAIELNQDFRVDLLVSAMSDYRTGGISQTLNKPALQFDASLHHASGLVLGVFTSNVDFDSDTRREYDYYAGIEHSFTDDVSASLIYYEYDYPKESEFNYGEWIGAATAYNATLGVKYTNDVKPFGSDRGVIWGAYSFNLPYETSLDVRFGYSDAKDPVYVSADGSARNGYRDWEVAASKELLGVGWRLAYVDTDLSKAECESSQGIDDICSATVLLSVSKIF